MATVVRKGAPSRSYPSRQRKLGPAPFASFEDLSDEIQDPENGANDQEKVKPMPEIKEDGARSPDDEMKRLPEGSPMVGTIGNPVFSVPSSMPTSGPTSGLQTPSTPRIDISCASSSTPASDDSNSERELFKGGLGFAFHEEGTEELRSSTEELDLGEDDLEDESSKKKKEKKEAHDAHEELLRRASHPANIFARKASTTTMALEEDQINRKPSAHSLYLDGFLHRPTRHSSFGSGDYTRPGAFSSLSNASGRRSASPHKMLLETSFCGNKPIPTKSIDLDSPPKETLDSSANKSGKISSDSSFEGQKPQTATTMTTVQVHHHGTPITTVAHPKQINLSSGGSQHIPSPSSPKSSDHWRPISPRSPKTPRSDNITSTNIPTTQFNYPAAPTGSTVASGTSTTTFEPGTTISAKNSAAFETKAVATGVATMVETSTPISTTSKIVSETSTSIVKTSATAVKSSRSVVGTNITAEVPGTAITAKPPAAPGPSKSVFSNTAGCVPVQEAKWERGSKSLVRETFYPEFQQEKPSSSNNNPSQQKQNQQERLAKLIKMEPPIRPTQMVTPSFKPKIVKEERKKSFPTEPDAAIVLAATIKTQNKCVQIEKETPSSPRVLEREFSDNDEITTELTISEDPVVTVEDVPIETKGFFLQESPEEDGDLPYVPTTLPLEKSVVVPIIPIKERRKLGSMVTTTPVQRPRCVRPPNPASLNDYISTLPSKTQDSKTPEAKMKINLPREDSIPDSVPNRPKSPKKKFSTSWTDFAELGLRSPREIRRRMREENGAIDDLSSYHSDSSQDTAGPVNGSDEETESLLKLPKVPFAMDLDVHSNRSSVVPSPHDDVPISPHSTGSPDLPRDNAQFKKQE